jgi:hypothetical protein
MESTVIAFTKINVERFEVNEIKPLAREFEATEKRQAEAIGLEHSAVAKTEVAIMPYHYVV